MILVGAGAEGRILKAKIHIKSVDKGNNKIYTICDEISARAVRLLRGGAI